MDFRRHKTVGTAGLLLVCALDARAQQPRQVTIQDYANAERFMNYNVAPLVYHGVSDPTWLADGRFWYRDAGPDGTTFMMVDPARRTTTPAFDHAKMAAALTRLLGGRNAASAGHLPIREFVLDGGAVIVEVDDKPLRCDLSGEGVCRVVGEPSPAGREKKQEPVDVSPDGRRAAFIRDWNLWVRDTVTGAETQLTTDGVKDFGYATDNAGWIHSDNPILLWSPDSQKDSCVAAGTKARRRNVSGAGDAWAPGAGTPKYPLPGDKSVTMIERVVVHIDTQQVVRFKMPPDEHRSSLCDDLSCKGGSGSDHAEWSFDTTHVGFVSTSRDHKQDADAGGGCGDGERPRGVFTPPPPDTSRAAMAR